MQSSYMLSLSSYVTDPTAGVVVAFAESSYNVREDASPVEVCVEIIMRSLAPGQSATVFISSVDGSAEGGLEHTL